MGYTVDEVLNATMTDVVQAVGGNLSSQGSGQGSTGS
jgi:hypothetical protein